MKVDLWQKIVAMNLEKFQTASGYIVECSLADYDIGERGRLIFISCTRTDDTMDEDALAPVENLLNEHDMSFARSSIARGTAGTYTTWFLLPRLRVAENTVLEHLAAWEEFAARPRICI